MPSLASASWAGRLPINHINPSYVPLLCNFLLLYYSSCSPVLIHLYEEKKFLIWLNFSPLTLLSFQISQGIEDRWQVLYDNVLRK